MLRTAFVAALLLALAGCAEKSAGSAEPAAAPAPAPAPASQPAEAPGKGEDPSQRDQRDDDGVARRGDAFTQTASLSVSEAVAQASALSGKTVKVEGVVEQVCAAKGCWFAIKQADGEGEGQTIRITSKGYRFFVPKDAAGERAVVEGELVVRQLSNEEAQHLEEDRAKATGEAAEKIEGEPVEVQIAAVAVELRPGG